MAQRVRIVNPRKKKGDNMAKARRNRKGQFVKGGGGGGRKRKRKRNPSTAVARRSSGGSRPARRGRRRRNPEGGGGLSLRSVWPGLIPAIAGRVWLAFAVRRWGGAWGTSVVGGNVSPSPFAGQAWTFQGYLVGMLATWVGAKLINRWKPGWGAHFWRSGVENMATRVVWTELIARSQWAQSTFGAQFTNDPYGNRWLSVAPGQQVAMMGYQQGMGQLQAARPLDGLQAARPLDGLERARPVDRKHGGVGGRRYRQRIDAALAPMGHYLPPGTEDLSARYQGSGSNSPYHSAYQSAY